MAASNVWIQDDLSETKYDGFTVRLRSPFNGGPQPDDLRRQFYTPNDAFYVRAHAAIPRIDAHSFRLTVGGLVERPLTLSLDDLKQDFETYSAPATLQCAGNRRKEFAEVAPMPTESVIWETDAISTGEWQGVRLRDVLERAGITPRAAHVEFVGLDRVERDGEFFGYGGSIPLEKATQPDVLLAYALNGETLPMTHGFPLRAVVPGYIAARSVKWLGAIRVLETMSDNYFQQRDYKVFPPHITAETADWSQGKMLDYLATDAVICIPADGTTVQAGRVHVEGYAFADGGDAANQVVRVELSTDGGASWIEMRLLGEARPFCWRFWESHIDLAPGTHQLVVRAHDTCDTIQPQTAAEIWNFKGYMNNSLHRVKVQSR